VLLGEVLTVMLEYKGPIPNPDRSLSGNGVVGVLQEFGQNMAGALNLLEELVPGTRKLGIGLELIPSPGRLFADRLEVAGGPIIAVPRHERSAWPSRN